MDRLERKRGPKGISQLARGITEGCVYPVPAKVTLLLSDEMSVRKFEKALHSIGPGFLPRLCSYFVRNRRGTSKINAKHWGYGATLHNVRDFEIVLPELVVGSCHVLPAELNTGKCVEAVE